MVNNIEALKGDIITPGKTLLVFDEVQNCEKALNSLKYFATDMPDLHVVAAWSLLGVHIAKNESSYPVGYVERLFRDNLATTHFWPHAFVK